MEESEMNWAQKLKAPEVKFPKKLFTFYLSHPFESRKKIREWELKFEKRHPNIALINPFYDVEGEGREDVKARDEGIGFKKEPGYDWRLVRRDKIAMLFSRGIIVVIDENSADSFGTKMEIVYARVLANNPKLLICTTKHYNHPWFKTHFHRIYRSFEEFEKDIEYQVARVKKKWGF